MTDWSASSDPYKDSDQDRLGSGKSERQYHSANWAMKWLKISWRVFCLRILQRKKNKYLMLLNKKSDMSNEQDSNFFDCRIEFWEEKGIRSQWSMNNAEFLNLPHKHYET